jgi:hypothetical protein
MLVHYPNISLPNPWGYDAEVPKRARVRELPNPTFISVMESLSASTGLQGT